MQNPVVPVAANEADDEEEYDIPGEIENVVGVLTLGRNYCNACKLNTHWRTTCLAGLSWSSGYLY